MDEDLVQAVNRGWLKRKDIPLALISPRLAFISLAKEISREYKIKKEYRIAKQLNVNNVKSVALPAYEGNNPYILRMIDFLKKHLKDDLAMACVHGSLGTYEEIAYSDFDALAVIKSEVFEDPKRLSLTMYNLFNAQRIMFDFDPLQHHGWFILTEADYDAFPGYYFPAVLFKYAKSLLNDDSQIRQINFVEDKEKSLHSFRISVAVLLSWAEKRKIPKNMYQLKSILSQLLLLPSLYVHCRDGKAVFKKYSFDNAKADFSSSEWSVMEEISLLRKSWQEYFKPSNNSVLNRNLVLFNLTKNKWSSKIPLQLESLISDGFFRRLELFLKQMTKKSNIHLKPI